MVIELYYRFLNFKNVDLKAQVFPIGFWSVFYEHLNVRLDESNINNEPLTKELDILKYTLSELQSFISLKIENKHVKEIYKYWKDYFLFLPLESRNMFYDHWETIKKVLVKKLIKTRYILQHL